MSMVRRIKTSAENSDFHPIKIAKTIPTPIQIFALKSAKEFCRKSHFFIWAISVEQESKITKKYYKDNQDAKRKFLDGREKNKPFDVFTKDGIFINTFTYQFAAKEYLQTKKKITSTINISSVLTGKRKSSAGFVFKYK